MTKSYRVTQGSSTTPNEKRWSRHRTQAIGSAGLIGFRNRVEENFGGTSYSVGDMGGVGQVYGCCYRSINHLLKDFHGHLGK